MKAPVLSIVIPTFDTPEMTRRCVEAARRAAPEETEILVVDDGGHDGIASRLAEPGLGVRTIRRETNGGFARAANDGVAASRGAVVLLLNSDVMLDPGAAVALLHAFERDRTLGVAGAVLRYPDGRPQWSGGHAPTPVWLFGVATGAPAVLGRLGLRRAVAPARVDWVTGAALAFRREVWDAAGPLDDAFRFYAQDLAFCLAAGRRGFGVGLVPEFRAVHAHGATVARGRGDGAMDVARHLPDLLRWARRYREPAFARRAARALTLGLALRRTATAFGSARRRADLAAAAGALAEEAAQIGKPA